MSDAIRCNACRWWREIQSTSGMRRGVCEIDTPIYVHGDPSSYMSWYQPMQAYDQGCSRGELKTEDAP